MAPRATSLPVPLVDENVIRLATVNNIVDNVNSVRLAKLETEERIFKSSFATGDASAFGNALPAESQLHLKVGAQVMFIKNDDQKPIKNSEGAMTWRWVNGTIGKIVSFGDGNQVLVEADNEIHTVGVSTWQKVRYLIEEEFNEETGKFTETLVPEVLAEFSSNVSPGTLLTAIAMPPVDGTSPLCKSRSFDIGVKRNSSSRLVGVGKSLGSSERITGV